MTKIPPVILFGVGAAVVIAIAASTQARAAATAVSNINAGTPFEGAGVVGTAGNVTNQLSGGTLSRFGSAVGLFFSDIFDRRTVDDLVGSPMGERDING